MQLGDDSLWESFPHALETLEGARRYISAFRDPLQELSTLNLQQIHTLWACSLLAIPPPIERMPPPGGFPTNLSELNLLGWAALVQDMVAGLQALPPNLGCDMGLLPKWPQVTPSESHWDSQKRVETPATSSSEPSSGATTAPVPETPGTHPNDTPAPMETGGAGDSQSWAEWGEAGIDEEFQKDRPVKHRRSQSKRREERPTLPFPLQDSEGRLASVLQLYKHAGEQPVAPHNVAAQGIIHLHPEMMPREATRLGNQVVCMIAEYHLTGSARGPSSLSPVLPEAAATLLPPINDYVPGGAFEGTRDVRVVDRARTLRVAAWLHRLDMSARGDGMASQTLEATRHSQGPLLDLFLTPMMGSLTFKEVVNRVLYENWRNAQSSLNDLR